MKEWLKELRFKLKIFGWYLITEPWRQIRQILIDLGRLILSVTKISVLMNWLLAFGILFLFLGNRRYMGLFLAVLLIAILLYEWQRGYFMYQWRRTTRERIKQKAVNEKGLPEEPDDTRVQKK